MLEANASMEAAKIRTPIPPKTLNQFEQGVTLTGRNRPGPLCSVGHPTAYAPGGRPACPPAALQTTTDDDRRQRAKQYWPIRRASNDGSNKYDYIHQGARCVKFDLNRFSRYSFYSHAWKTRFRVDFYYKYIPFFIGATGHSFGVILVLADSNDMFFATIGAFCGLHDKC